MEGFPLMGKSRAATNYEQCEKGDVATFCDRDMQIVDLFRGLGCILQPNQQGAKN